MTTESSSTKMSYVIPVEWKSTADALKGAADLILAAKRRDWEAVKDLRGMERIRAQEALPTNAAGPRLTVVYGLLLGLAIENLLKGIHLARMPQDVKRIRQLWAGTRGHDLPRLAREAGLSLSNAAWSTLLADLTLCINWAGRYPVPLRGDEGYEMELNPASIDALYAELLKQFREDNRQWCERANRPDCIDADGVPSSARGNVIRS